MKVSKNLDKLNSRFNIEDTVLKISGHFIEAISIENAINLAIMEVGNLCKIDNVCVFLFDEDNGILTLINEWSKTSHSSNKKILITPKEISWFCQELRKDKPVQMSDIKSILQGENTKKFFINIQIQSIVAFRLKIEEKIAGSLLLCSKEENHEWSKEDLLILQISSDIISNVLEKHHVLEKLKISEKKYRNIIENMKDAIIITAFDGDFIYASPQYYDIIGEKEGSEKRLKFSRLHPEEREKLLKLFSEAVIKKETLTSNPIEYRILHKEGHYVWVSSISKNYYDEHGNIIGFISTLRDISEKKEVELKFKETEEKYHSFINDFQGIAYQAESISSNPFFFRGNVQEITGYLEEDFYQGNITWEDLIIPEDSAIKKEEGRKLNEIDGYITDIKYRIRKKDGEIKWIRDLVRSVSSGIEKKQVIQGIIYDITEQVKADEKLKISEEKYRRMTENANDLIVVFNQDYEIEYINETVHEKVLGYSREDIKNLAPIDFIHPHSREKTQNAFLKIFEEGEGSLETKLIHSNGTPIWFHLKGNTFIDVDNKKKILIYARDITMQKEATKKLKESEKKYRLITENANDIIGILDDKFRLEYVNEEPCYRIMGYKIDEVMGKSTLEILHPEDADKTMKVLNRGIISGEGAIEARIKHKNGHYIWLDIKGNVFYNDKDELKIILIARDVSFRKKAEVILKESEEKLRSFMNSATDAFFIWDSNLNLVDVSDIGIKDYFPNGTIKESIIGHNIIDIVPNLKGSDILKDFLNTLNSGEPIILEHNYKDPKVGRRYLSVKTFKVGEGLGMIVSDTTKQKLADTKLKQSEQKYKQLFETAPYAIALISLNGNINDCNPATEKIFGYTKQDLLNKNFKDLAHYPKEILPKVSNRFKRVAKGENVEPDEFQIYKKDGTSAWILSQLNLVKLGSEFLVQVIIFDITENKRAEKLIKQEIERLREIDQIRNDLVRRISHELKTPLISIFSTSQHLIENYREDLSPKIFNLISTIHKGGKRLKLLSDNLINSLRLESSGLKLNFRNQDLVKVINDSIDSFQIFMKERGILLKKEIPEELHIKIDEIWISQAISNLLSNAIKNTPKMGAIFIKLKEDDDYIDIIVSDTGVGITKKEREKLFTRFGKIERFDEDLDIITEGSGLGLYISREIVQLHNGDILVESKGRHKGSIFTIRLFKNKKYG
ncbi:MAG: PAS domain S-box protein [Promethearchaeota archaeon]